jgi:hypothetical protein
MHTAQEGHRMSLKFGKATEEFENSQLVRRITETLEKSQYCDSLLLRFLKRGVLQQNLQPWITTMDNIWIKIELLAQLWKNKL